MKIRSFEDIKKIDDELACLFLRPDEAGNWIYAVENSIKEWIGKYNKQYWEVVRYVSEKRGILGKLEQDNTTIQLTREDFAKVLLKFCPNAVKQGETIRALKSSMDHYQFASIWKKLDKKPDAHIVRPRIKEVEDLLDKKYIIESNEEESSPTLEDLLVEYLRREVDEQENKFPRSKICIRPQYDGINPAISVETYKSEQLLNENRPSHIEAYEFYDGVLQKSKLDELTGQYYNKPVKLFIVSSRGLLPEVRALATNRNIGYVRLNPNKKMTSENYILPRSINDYTKDQHYLKELADEKPLTLPILILDDSMISSSLTDVLCEHGVVVKNHRLLNIPFLSDDGIEKITNDLTAKDVEIRIQMIKKNNIQNVDLSLDPFAYATSCGLNYKTEMLDGDFQLGRLDVEKNLVILNSAGLYNNNRYRFTMAHELGHYTLHAPLFREQGIVSVGESEETLTISNKISLRLEYQANKFASCLLMPKELVGVLYVYYFQRCVHQIYGDNLHALYYNPEQRETWQSYNCVVGNMARNFGVSLQAMNIRLKSLDLLKTLD